MPQQAVGGDMSKRDGLSWFGGTKPIRDGGIVSSVGLNQARPRQAIHPDPVGVPSPARRPKGRSAIDSGPNVDVRRIADEPDPTTRPSGRFRLPK